jgi:hypothetical protein
MIPSCYYGASKNAPSYTGHLDSDLIRMGLDRYPLPRECFFYNREEAEFFFNIHKTDPGKDKKAYYNLHCFLRKNISVSVDEIIRKEANQYTGKLLRYDDDLFQVVDRNGKPFLKEFEHEKGKFPSSVTIVNATFRTMFLIESDLT